ncbi:MAG: hypothetical protein AAGD14_02105 [Planctomycetota bacterium]
MRPAALLLLCIACNDHMTRIDSSTEAQTPLPSTSKIQTATFALG